MGLVCVQNSSLLVYSKSQKVSASYCLPFQHSRGKNQPVGGFLPPGLFRDKMCSFSTMQSFLGFSYQYVVGRTIQTAGAINKFRVLGSIRSIVIKKKR